MRTPAPKAAVYAFAELFAQSASSSVPVRTGNLQEDFDSYKLLRKTSQGFPAVKFTARGEFYPHIWHIIEYGSIKNPPYAPLRRGAERASLKWEEGA